MMEGWTAAAAADPLPPWSSRRMAFPDIAPSSAPAKLLVVGYGGCV